jgi:hypothetical protein
MTTATLPKISAAAISRILSSNPDLKKAHHTGWSIGFCVIGYGTMVEVIYQTTDKAEDDREMNRIVSTINDRKDRKYFAERTLDEHGSEFVKVTVRQETEEDRMEKAAEESPYGVTIKEVRAALNKSRRFYEFEEGRSAGFSVEREAAPNDHRVRVTYRDVPHTSYAPETGGRDVYAHTITTHYANVLMAAGYAACIDYTEANGDSLLVGQQGEFTSPEQAAEEAVEPLRELRDAVEADSLSYMTRKAGPTSIFIYYLVPFKDKLRRLEVFWSNGSYVSCGRFGGSRSEFHNLDLTLRFIRSELAD